MQPLISYDTMYFCALLIALMVASMWAIYETVQWFKRRREVIRAPQPRCVAGGPREFVGRP